jgi:hypothetical protein
MLLPSTWWAAVAAPHKKPLGNAPALRARGPLAGAIPGTLPLAASHTANCALCLRKSRRCEVIFVSAMDWPSGLKAVQAGL